jgi:hypothetical protein
VHRPDVDAIFAAAKGYSFSDIFLFLATLAETGFMGDAVLGVSSEHLDGFATSQFQSAIPYNIILYGMQLSIVLSESVKWSTPTRMPLPTNG